jgi:hypothetical protein
MELQKILNYLNSIDMVKNMVNQIMLVIFLKEENKLKCKIWLIQ